MDLRHATYPDHRAIKAAVPSWWSESRSPEQAQVLSKLLPPLFLQHFASTSWIAEEDGELAGFVVGFHSADRADEAYVHFTGVDPRLRGRGVGRSMYDRFFDQARAAGRTTIRAITSPHNTGSIAFHTAVGFAISPGDKEVDGVSVHGDYDAPGEDRVCFVATLAA
ncbi:GNAT family N-acetyltransferase [Solicola gregarius]|uniref:GNAT family N-acetyltransferase n=1 Tax=Solicola gregarius TaxID=2908642 RepID=A0AA46YLB2_9ACTN|nr:GNAT family N-acetyltransferase [Solicola gregarius]UYM06417.1 GNAT family N-acetyltransferase [Solicola gregarius]